MTQNKVIEIEHNINDKKDAGDYVVMIIAFIISFITAIGVYLLTIKAMQLCASQCSGENCKYVIEGIKEISRNICILIGWISFMFVSKRDATIILAQKTAKQIGGILKSFKKGCSSSENEEK